VNTDAASWRPTKESWEIIKERSLEQTAVATIEGLQSGTPEATLSRETVDFRTSNDHVAAPIFYREVPRKAFANFSSIRWRFGDVSSYDPPRTVSAGWCRRTDRDCQI
jgi:hypothetical protein